MYLRNKAIIHKNIVEISSFSVLIVSLQLLALKLRQLIKTIKLLCFIVFFYRRNGHPNITPPNSATAGVSLQTKTLIYHQECPMTPVFTALGFEVFYLFYGLLALFSQYVNIYKTVGSENLAIGYFNEIINILFVACLSAVCSVSITI